MKGRREGLVVTLSAILVGSISLILIVAKKLASFYFSLMGED